MTSAIYHFHSSEYTIWIPTERDNLSLIGDVSEQRKTIKRLSHPRLNEIREQLCTNDMFSCFTFARASTLSKYNSMQFVLLEKNSSIVYLLSPSKDITDYFTVFHPSDPTKVTIKKEEVASDDVLSQYPYIAIRDNPWDIRPIEQITMLLLDISGSMTRTRVVGSSSPLDLSISALAVWFDRFCSLELPHAVGLTYFGAKTNETTKLIQEASPITRNFKDLENALKSRPDCGSSTPLYQAIDDALSKIDQFQKNNQNKIRADCKKFIFCFSDGEDTCSQVKLPAISQRLNEENVTFDSMCFTMKRASSLVQLCESSKGYYYFPIPDSKDEWIALFEREPTIVVKNRDESVYGVIERPKLRASSNLHAKAVSLSEAPMTPMNVSNQTLNRVLRESNNLKQNPLENVTIYVGKKNIMFWKLILEGPIGTPYAGYRWLLSVEFPPQTYPSRPPDIRFQTPIYHCNISDDGKVCHEVLRNFWTTNTTMRHLLQEIITLLAEPQPFDALSTGKGYLLRTSPEEYKEKQKAFHDKHAAATVDELKAQFTLEQFGF